MSTEKPVTIFLNGIAHLVQTAETYAVPRTADEYYTAMQARGDAEALIDHTQQTLMFLMQRLKKLPPLPDIQTLTQEEEAKEQHV